jgi:hypothetical protein
MKKLVLVVAVVLLVVLCGRQVIHRKMTKKSTPSMPKKSSSLNIIDSRTICALEQSMFRQVSMYIYTCSGKNN